ncbi:MAG: acetyl-CoA decarbonylase/synthase complex subunit alpha [Dehalococcoidia bacterium]|nr:acetyl-CoA decarbonylase/synthase complex subunit alpha [Dehalococcoidia bacterium]MDD5494516.1 acetyl-CoA decarbonylase/synthase complex subunit alpha [Dehalococcoidia bacterium]
MAKNARSKIRALNMIRADDAWEPVGHTPLPDIIDLRNWDRRLLETWKPLYVPVSDKCNMCTYGECNLAEGRKGACGMDSGTFQARLTLQACCAGTAAVVARARKIVEYLVEKRGAEFNLELGDKVGIEAPHIRTVIGLKPATLADLQQVLVYLDGQLAGLLSAANSGVELSNLDFESKALHASMLGHVAMECADIAQIAGFGFPSSRADTPLVDAGPGSLDPDKPTVLVIGNDTITAVCLADYVKGNHLEEKVQVACVGPVAHELARYYHGVKVLGTISQLPNLLTSKMADVIICGGGSQLTDPAVEAAAAGSAFMATDSAACYGLNDLTANTVESIEEALIAGKGALVLDPEKAAEVAVKAAQEVFTARKAGKRSFESANSRMRAGRGPIMDTEIRKVGAPLVLGTIPGVIAIVGGSNYPGSPDDIAEIAEEFAKRKYIVVLAGDSAITAALKKDADGKSIYERYPPDFDAGGIVNIGSGIAAAHISGAAIKIASIFATLPLRANYEVVADYILNRVGAAGLAWGACGEEELALATGCNRLGIPVIVGPRSIKYGRLYISGQGVTDWSVMDGREKKLVDTGEPSPEHLLNLLDDKGKAMVALAKLCMRKNDTPQGRATKLTHYIGLSKQYCGGLPEDIHLFVRRTSDIPIFFKKEVQARLLEKGWQEKPVLSLPTIIGTYPSEVSLDEVVH